MIHDNPTHKLRTNGWNAAACQSVRGLLFRGGICLLRLLATASPSIAASPSVNLIIFSSLGPYVRMIALGSTIVHLEKELSNSHNVPAFKTSRRHTFACQYYRVNDSDHFDLWNSNMHPSSGQLLVASYYLVAMRCTCYYPKMNEPGPIIRSSSPTPRATTSELHSWTFLGPGTDRGSIFHVFVYSKPERMI
jgi:hypothetical protein